MTNKTKPSPAVLLAIFSVACIAVIIISSLLFQKDVTFINHQVIRGLDYRDFYIASQNLLEGISPYQIPNERYLTTPAPALLNTLLAPLSFETAYWIFFALIVFSVFFAYYLSCLFFPGDPNNTRNHNTLFGGFIVISFSYPFYFLIERGNIDGLVFLFVCAGLYFSEKRESLAGFCFALAIVFKIYPILLLIPIILYRRWRLLSFSLLFTFLMSLTILPWSSDFLEIITQRSQGEFRFDENGSIVSTFAYFIIILSATFNWQPNNAMISAPIFAGLFLSILLSILIFITFKRGKNHTSSNDFKFNLILFFPFMLSIPQISYHYVLINLLVFIPVIQYIHSYNATRRGSIVAALFTIGLALSQWQAIAFYQITGNMLSHFLPGLGLLLIMVAATLGASLHFSSPENLNETI